MKSSFLPALSRTVSVVVVSALLGGAAFAQAPAAPAAPGAAPAAPGAAPAAPAAPAKPLAAGDATYVKSAVKSLAYLAALCDAGKPMTDAGQVRVRDTAAKDLSTVSKALNKFVEAHPDVKAPAEVAGTDKVDLERVNKAFAKPDKVDPAKPQKEWAGAMAKELKRLDHETEMAGKTAQDADLKTFVSNYGPSIRSSFNAVTGLEKALTAKKK
jgi:hypothetical protein